jgi:hypothetical protein
MNSTPSNYLSHDVTSRHSFHKDFDRLPFAFTHHLDKSEYFSLAAMQDLVARMAPKTKRWYMEQGDTKPENGWSAGSSSQSLQETLAGIAENRSLIILKRVQEEPEYKQIFDIMQEELSDLSGIDIGSHYRDGLMTVLITSPGRTTPYHIDGEANLLLQMSGTKLVYIFDGNNQEVLPSQELERFWAGDIKAPLYREHLQDRAWKYEIGPGDGVSNPVIFPHWVKNGPEVSISLSVNFKRVVDNSADAHKINSQLRKLGLSPLQPGNKKMVDHTKAVAYRTVKRVKRYVDSMSSK